MPRIRDCTCPWQRRTTNHVENVIETRYPLTLGGRETGNGVNLWLIDGDTGDSNPLLHDLKPDHQLHATSGVELAGTDAKEHMEIRVVLGSLPLQLGDVADILELSLSLARVCTSLATESPKDVARFFLTPNFGQPTWRFGEEPNDAEEEQKRYDLECNGEPPNKAGCPVTVKRAGAIDRSASKRDECGKATYYSSQ